MNEYEKNFNETFITLINLSYEDEKIICQIECIIITLFHICAY